MTLSMPILWILLPLAAAGITVLLAKKRLLSLLLTGFLSLGLAALAFFFPENLSLNLGPLTINFVEGLNILGRQILVPLELLPFIALLFGATGLWVLSSAATAPHPVMPAISLAITALLTASLGIEPFLYAALFIQAVVLISIPMLSPVAEGPSRGILRYLSLQTAAMPFILFAGWLLSGVETLPPESALIGQSALVLGLGFALLLAIFPFHSWVPMVSEDSHPAAASYLLFIVPTAIIVFGLKFLNRYPFLRELENLTLTLRLFGTVMILIGGLWTALQDKLSRAFGFSSLAETGFSLLALSLVPQDGITWLVLLIPARALGFWLWGYALARIQAHAGSLTIQDLRGFARRCPFLAIALLLSQLSVAGLPLLAAFPVKINLFTALRASGLAFFAWSFIGNLGLFLFSLRALASLVRPQDEGRTQPWSANESTHEIITVVLAVLFLVLIGLMPGTFLGWITDILTAFPQLQ